jgi:outer membrane lipoprotein
MSFAKEYWKMRMGKYIRVVLLSALLSGCASYPISQNLRNQSQRLSYSQVAANPKSTRGAMVVWGGRIIDTVNDTNGSEAYVLMLPLNRNERPPNLRDGISAARFIMVSGQTLDPATYANGCLITVAGRLDGVRNERLQNVFFRYPVLNIQQIHLWSNPPKDYYYYYYGARREDESRSGGASR